MAAPFLRSTFSVSKFIISGNLQRSIQVTACRFLNVSTGRTGIPSRSNISGRQSRAVVEVRHSVCQEQIRYGSGGSFFMRYEGQQLWNSVVGVSNPGKKKGRAKRQKKRPMDLNRGQKLGDGSRNMAWPGLNTQLTARGKLLEIEERPMIENRIEKLAELRGQVTRTRHPPPPPLLRGYSGKRAPGTSAGPPDPIGNYTFEGFDSVVLESRLVNCMTGTVGRKARFSSMVAVGNKNGLLGVALAKSTKMQTAVKRAKNKAAGKLQYIERYDNHTAYHNMYKYFHMTKIFIHKKEKGYGLRCHRVLKSLCQLAGIKDLHVKIEGSGNVRKAVYAFMEAFQEQETHQKLADRTGFYIVEQRKERNNFPEVVAAPTEGKIATEPIIDEEHDIEMNFERLYFDGKVEYKKPKKLPPWEKFNWPSWQKKQIQVKRRRGQMDAKLQRRAGLA